MAASYPLRKILLSLFVFGILALSLWIFASKTLAPEQDPDRHADHKSQAQKKTQRASTINEEELDKTKPSELQNNQQSLQSSEVHDNQPASNEEIPEKVIKPKLSEEDIDKLLQAYQAAFQNGKFQRFETIEAQLLGNRPLSAYHSYATSLLDRSLAFNYRLRLLKLAVHKDSDTLWELFSDLYADFFKAETSLDWKEGEKDFLRELIFQIAPLLWHFKTGLQLFEDLLLRCPDQKMIMRALEGLDKVAPEGQASYLPLLERVFTENPDFEIRRKALELIFRFTPEQSQRSALFERSESKPFHAFLVTQAFRFKLLDLEESALRADIALENQGLQGRAELLHEYATVYPERALLFARPKLQGIESQRNDQKREASLMATVFIVLTQYGSKADRENIERIAASPSRYNSEAFHALKQGGSFDFAKRLFEGRAPPAIKALALAFLFEKAAFKNPEAWLEEGLAHHQPQEVRVLALSLLDPLETPERERLMLTARSERSLVLREKALRLLGELESLELYDFFKERSTQEASTTLRLLALTYAKDLEKKRQRQEDSQR